MAIILGINCAYHESAAAAVTGEGEVLAAVEEERFSRRKHGKAALVSNADELPCRAIEHVLDGRPEEVALVAIGFAPRARGPNVGADPPPLGDPAGWGSERSPRRTRGPNRRNR